MTKFIFLRGYLGTINMMDSQTFATASLYNPNTFWTPEESERLRIERMRISNDLRDDLLRDLGHIEQTRLTEQESMIENISRSLNQIQEQQLRLFQATTTVTVNPTIWTNIKIFGTRFKLVLKECWQREPIGLIFCTTLLFIVMFIFFMKLFGA